jgi:hypothetical protein
VRVEKFARGEGINELRCSSGFGPRKRGRGKWRGGGSSVASTWRRGGGGLDARCVEGGRQLRVSDGGGNGWEARGQGREAADV